VTPLIWSARPLSSEFCSVRRISACADPLRLFERAGGGKHSQPLRDEEIAPVAIGDLFDVAGAPQFVNVLE
jgi:hypothetical protein